VAKVAQVNVRLEPDECTSIDHWVERGDFDSRSEFIRFALRKVIKAYEGNRIGFEIDNQPKKE